MSRATSTSVLAITKGLSDSLFYLVAIDQGYELRGYNILSSLQTAKFLQKNCRIQGVEHRVNAHAKLSQASPFLSPLRLYYSYARKISLSTMRRFFIF